VQKDKSIQIQCTKKYDSSHSFTGFHSEKTTSMLLNTSMHVLNLEKDELADAFTNHVQLMAELAPQDGFEGLLITQMVAVFNQVMDHLRVANIPNNKRNEGLYNSILNRATKLMRLYNQQLETLDKHRRKGNQKMTVEHVHVHKGGQAIVGEVHQGGGANNEK